MLFYGYLVLSLLPFSSQKPYILVQFIFRIQATPPKYLSLRAAKHEQSDADYLVYPQSLHIPITMVPEHFAVLNALILIKQEKCYCQRFLDRKQA